MIERSQHLRFSLEAREAFGIKREGLRQDLERDIAIELRVARAPDLPHAALANEGGDFVTGQARTGGQGHMFEVAVIIASLRSRRPRGMDR